MLKVLHIFGTRPEAIKMAPVIMGLGKRPGEIVNVVCVTGQHRQLLDQCLSLFGITADYDLHLMTEDQSLSQFTATALPSLSQVLVRERPGLVLVQGDTISAMLAGMASFYDKIPVGHVEAGLRTRNRYSPFPEEINRRLISVLATLHFAPTNTAADALVAEGVPKDHIFVTGNTIVDALHMIVKRSHRLDHAEHVDGNKTKVILVTAHRRENFGKPLENICLALREIVSRNADVEIVFPVHPNPRVKGTVFGLLAGQDRVRLVEPLEYESFVRLLESAYLVLTDSGGIQEEAPVLGKPVLVMRNETERPEAVVAGTAKLVGTDRDAIVTQSELLLRDPAEYAMMARAVSPYGDGKAAERIVGVIRERFCLESAYNDVGYRGH